MPIYPFELRKIGYKVNQDLENPKIHLPSL